MFECHAVCQRCLMRYHITDSTQMEESHRCIALSSMRQFRRAGDRSREEFEIFLTIHTTSNGNRAESRRLHIWH